MAKTDLLTEAMKYHIFMQQLKGTQLTNVSKKLTNEAKEFSNAKNIFDLRKVVDEHQIKLNKEDRDEYNFKAKIKQDEQNAFDKERDEIQDNIKIFEDSIPGSGLDFLAGLPDDQKKYLPYASQHADSVKASGSLIISDVNSILVDSSIPYAEKKKRIVAIQTANPTIGAGTKSNIAGAIGMVDNKIYEEVKTGWLVDNPNHPDAGRISKLPADDAYKQILQKNALKDINAVFNRITKSTDTAFQLDMLEGAGLGVDLKGVKKAVGARLKQDIKTINDASRKATENDGELYNKSFLEIKKRYPQYFDNNTNSVKPQFKSIVLDSINSHYNRLRQQPQQQP